MADLQDILPNEKPDQYPRQQLVVAAIHLLTGMGIRKTHRQTAVDEITLHWMRAGAWHKDAMMSAYYICMTNKLRVVPSVKEAIL